MGLSRFSKPKSFERRVSGSVDDGGGGTLWREGARWGTSWGAADWIGGSFLDWIGGASEAFSSSADNWDSVRFLIGLGGRDILSSSR